MTTRKRRIKQADITFISLCPRGKNRLPVLFKDDGAFEFDTLVKDDLFEEEGLITAVVTAPEFPDTDGDVTATQVIKEMAFSHARNGSHLDIRHNLKPVPREDAFIAENYLIKKGDPDFADQKDRDGNPVDVTGGWAITIKLEKEELKADYRAGRWDGVSMFGNAQVELLTKGEPDVDKILDALAERLGQTQETDMELKELTTALSANNEALSKSLVEALSPLLVKKEEKPKEPDKVEDGTPEFKGDPLDVKAVKEHLQLVKADRLAKSVDFNDPKAVENYLASLEKEEEPDKDSDEVKSLRKQLAKAVKASTQTEPDKEPDKEPDEGNVTGLKKEDFARAKRMADYINGPSTDKS